MKKLFSNVERKLKTAAKVVFVLGLILIAIYLFALLYQMAQYASYGGATMALMFLANSVTMLILLGSVLLSSWCLYGFGELIEHTKSTNHLLWDGMYGNRSLEEDEGAKTEEQTEEQGE